MTIPEIVEDLRTLKEWFCNEGDAYPVCLEQAIKELESRTEVEANLFDEEEVHENCTVQILRNSQTGEVSIGWWKNE